MAIMPLFILRVNVKMFVSTQTLLVGGMLQASCQTPSISNFIQKLLICYQIFYQIL
jgi:hypothetical protein